MTTLTLGIFLAGLFAASASALGAPNAEDRPDFSKIAPHPRLFLNKPGEESLKRNIQANPRAKEIHNAILSKAEKAKSKPLLTRNQIGVRILHTSREMLDRMFLWGYAWRMTGDESYALRAKREIENVAAFEDWNPSHFLDTAEMSLAFAIAYDWFHDAFDADTKKLIAGELARKAFAPFYSSKHFWFRPRHASNWNQVCSAGLLCAAIAVHETDTASTEKIISLMLENITYALRDCYSPSGAYTEGATYWQYGTSYQLYFNEALVSAFGSDMGLYEKYPSLLKSAKFIIHSRGPTGRPFSFYDSGQSVSPRPLLFFFAGKTGDASLVYTERDLFSKPYDGISALFSILTAPSASADGAPPPRELCWFETEGEVPLFMARTGWSKNDLYFAAKGGHASTNHGHMDASSFVFDALGERWAFDLGGQEYNSLEKLGMKIWGNLNLKNSDRWKVWRYTNYMHNMLTVNDALISPTADIRLSEYSANPENMRVAMDTTALYAPDLKKSVRRIALAGGKLRVSDEIENGAGISKIRWTMCTHKNARVADTNTIEITSPSGKTLLVKLVSPRGFKAEVLSADSGNSWDAKNPNYSRATFTGEFGPNEKGEIVVDLIPQN